MADNEVAGLSMANLSEKVKQKVANSQGNQKPKQKGDKKAGSKDKKNGRKNDKKNDRQDSTPKNKPKYEKKSRDVSSPAKNGNGSDLLKEIEELGGSKEDLELINGADTGSDSEVEFDEGSGEDADLTQDLSSYMKEIGFTVSDEKLNNKQKKEDYRDKINKDREDREERDRKKEKTNEKQSKANDNKNVQLKSFKIDELVHPGKMVLESRTDWYSPDIDAPVPPSQHLDQATIEKLYTKCKDLLTKENEVYIHQDAKSSSQKQFLSQLLSSGTLSDKISALTLLIQESPLHSIKYLDQLLGLCRKKARRTALQGVAAIKDLFVGGVLPDRKLKWFKNQPLSLQTPLEWLLVWVYEDWLKGFYFNLLQTLEVLSHDTIENIRSSTVIHVFDLLKAKPEQEVNLLRLGVNKLGDSDRKVASKVSYCLLQLEQQHPAMKAIVVESITELIFRSGSDYHARYYSTITLNQTILAHKDIELANTLMKTYLNLFERLLAEWDKTNGPKKEEEPAAKVKKPRWKNKGNKGKHGGTRQEAKTAEVVKEEENAKLNSAILTGLNRAFPFSDLPSSVFDQHLDTLYRVTHSANFNTGVQALILIHQITKKREDQKDRFYRTLYESLLDPRLTTSAKLRLYLNLMYKALKSDSNQDRLKAFAKRMMQVASSWLSIGAITAVIYLLIQIEKAVPNLRELLSEHEPAESEAACYDGKKRDPAFANASSSRLWELAFLAHHYHPTVSYYADAYLNNDDSELIKPDLTLHTLVHFLDKFVYKNARKPTSKGQSIMQPLAGGDAELLPGATDGSQKPINARKWSDINLEDVDVSERFFHQYFTSRGPTQPQNEKAKKTDEEDEEIDDDEVWKALVASQPEIEGEGSDLSDMDDLDEEDISLDESDLMEDEDIEEDSDAEADLIEGEDDDSGSGIEAFDMGDEDDSDSGIEAFDMGDEDEDEDEDEDDNEQGGDSEDEFEGFDDEEGLLDSDAEIEAPMAAKSETKGKKRALKDSDDGKKKSKRQRLKDLPEFADADEYAQYLQSSDEDYS
uniref:ARAD1B03190p n=1 Tax=Blastobotrys adeninivorans TaxID=409370 RepID=A0A060T4W5_BLAAD